MDSNGKVMDLIETGMALNFDLDFKNYINFKRHLLSVLDRDNNSLVIFWYKINETTILNDIVKSFEYMDQLSMFIELNQRLPQILNTNGCTL